MIFFKNKCTAYKRGMLRHDIRTIQKLSNSDDPMASAYLLLEVIKLVSIDKDVLEEEPLFRGVDAEQIEHCIRQIVVRSFSDGTLLLRFTKALSSSKEKEIFPLPPSARKHLQSKGIAFAQYRSHLAWNVLKVKLFLDGMNRIAKILLTILRKRPRSVVSFAESTVFMRSDQFVNIMPDAIDGKWSFLEWYRKSSFNHIANIILHRLNPAPSVEILPKRVFLSDTYFDTSCAPDKNKPLLLDLAFAALKGALHIFGSKWWYAILLREIADLAYARSMPKNAFAKQYFIPVNHMFTRYLWTYMAERQGSQFAVLHYSHSCKEFQTISPKYNPPNYGYALTSWPMHVVWGKQHIEALRENATFNAAFNSAVYIVDPPIFFSRPETPFPIIEGPVVVIFDITTSTLSGWAKEGYRNTYLCLANQLEFIRQCAFAIRRAGATPVLKSKDLGSKLKFWREFASTNNFVLLPNEMIAPVAIEHSSAAISMPFTTSGAVATYLGKPSCYFDPTGTLKGFDDYAFSAPLIVGLDALDIWIHNALSGASPDDAGL